MGTSNYSADTEDLAFVLFDQIGIQDTLAGYEAFDGYDRETYASILEEAARLAEDVLDPVNKVGDEVGVKLASHGNVVTPDEFNEAWNLFAEGGWIGTTAPVEFGGSGLPNTLGITMHEMFSAAACAFNMYPGLTGAAARVVKDFAPANLRALVAEKLFTGEWAGTMCLTEAGAGSDVGANRAKATPTSEEGVYLLEGEKIFISGGDQDLTANICHLILARTPDAPAGTKGLSIFLVPKFNFDADGNLGDRNGAFVSGIEEKMGLHGSATCTVLLGADGPCKGWLMGEEGQGMPIMFHMMNEARLGVAAQSLGLAANAYQNSLAYAKERKQGSHIESFRDANAPRAAIIDHPDVRRMLAWQKVHVETMRSLVMRMSHLADISEHDTDKAKAEAAHEQLDLLTPVAKAHCSDIGFECTVQALQVLGGYGYIREYPVEQHVRDAKICTIYEGTNGIQAMDLVGRKMRMKSGGVFMAWIESATKTCAAAKNLGLEKEAGLVEKSLQHLGATAMHLSGMAMQGNLKGAMLQATNFQRMFGTIVLAVEAVDQARAAAEKIAAGTTTNHLAAKAISLRFYVHNVLPTAIALGKGIQSDDGAALDEALFA